MEPAFIKDNPVMQIAFRDFVTFAYGEPDFLAAFKEHSGIDIKAKKSTIDFMIDETTGKMEADLTAFIDWLIEFHWGAEGAENDRPE